MKHIRITDLYSHPQNPRLTPRNDVVEQIAAQINGKMDEAHALIVRPNGKGYQIISGHNRKLAAERAGLKQVPCWVREMSDDEAYMALALNNAQGELHPLEIGLHALGSGLSGSEYARQIGKPQTTVADYIKAGKVAQVTNAYALADRWRHLSELHSAPQWLWQALVAALIENAWTVEATRKMVQRFKEIDTPPEWADAEKMAASIVGGAMKTSDVARFEKIVQDTGMKLRANDFDLGADDDLKFEYKLTEAIKNARPATLSAVIEICNGVLDEQTELIRQRQQADFLRTRREEEVAARIARLRQSVSLEEWKKLADDERAALLATSKSDLGRSQPGFNKQENDAIEWAQWSWNPVTGCLHDCPYCYARDIANQVKMEKAYPNGFAPTFRPISVLAPRFASVPKEARGDTRYRNVFTCSMADLFGRWVPSEWVEAVLKEIHDAPQWNFLCLTKFPKRMAEFDIPENMWMGTTVDLQARVANAESAFAKIKSKVKWLSIEPMLEPLKFKKLDLFNWVVIGGASSSTETPEWKPPFEWHMALYNDAKAAGCAVYQKTNLLGKRILEMPFNAPVKDESAVAPKVFHYLKKAKE